MISLADKRVLITAANGDFAISLARAFADSHPGLILEGADANGDIPGRLFFRCVHALPLASAFGYADAVFALARKIGVDAILPCSEAEMAALLPAHSAGKTPMLLMNAPELVATFLDKRATAVWLAQNGIKSPSLFLPEEATPDQLPLFMKRRTGSGSRDTLLIDTPALLAAMKPRAVERDLVFQEYVPDDSRETTTAMIRVGSDLRWISFKRRLLGGLTAWAETISDPALDNLVRRISAAIPVGKFPLFLNVQARLTDQGPRVFEINGRLSSTSLMRYKIGFRDAVWMLEAFFGAGEMDGYTSPALGTQVFRLADEKVFAPS